MKLELTPEAVRSFDDFAPAVRAMVEQGASAIVVVGAAIFFEHPQQLADLMVKARLPGIFFRREQVEAGGLMSYGTNFPDMYAGLRSMWTRS